MNKEIEEAIKLYPMETHEYVTAIRNYYKWKHANRTGRPSKINYFLQELRENKDKTTTYRNGDGWKDEPTKNAILRLAKEKLSTSSYYRFTLKARGDGLI